LLKGGGQECSREEFGLGRVGDDVDNFLITVERRDEDARDYSAVDGRGAEGIELEECDEVVWTEGEDNVKLLFPRFL
jgi:hypothetical protein